MMDELCPIRRIDHLEFYVGNARQAAAFYESRFGFRIAAYRGLETGSRDVVSYLMEQGGIRVLLTTALSSDNAVARHVHQHGDGVGVIALEVPDVAHTFDDTTRRGAIPAARPTAERDDTGTLRTGAIRAYGETTIRFVERGDYVGAFAPGFRTVAGGGSDQGDVGLQAIDHVVANVELGAMDRWVRFFSETMGFTELVHFDDEAISTEYSALMSKVMQDGTGTIKFPINEPATGRRKSQIEEFLDYYGGPGVQHVACSTTDIIGTVSALRARGVAFLRVPDTYYENLERRVGPLNEPVDRLARFGILADRDEDGYLLQIFTQPVQDRPTVFFEIIERHGSRGFGQGNFKSLFEAIEREQARRGNLVATGSSRT